MANSHKIGNPLIELSTVDSTNNYAMHLINENMAVHGLVVRADYQTHGKGQHGNIWKAEESKNLLLSILLDMREIRLEDQFLINATFCLATANLLMDEYEIPEISIKWPNDVYAGNRKIAGILIENVIRGTDWQYAIVGIGVNINQLAFPELTSAISLKQITKKNHSVPKCTKVFLKYLNAQYAKFDENRAEVLDEYNSLLMGHQQQISYVYKHELRSGKLLFVEKSGEISIQTNTGKESYRHKEIELEIQ